MNLKSSLTASNQWQQRAERCLIGEDYSQAASLYEQAIAAEPSVSSHYWYLGLMLLLQGQQVEAQTTWFLVMVEGEPEQVELWNAELVQVLQTEAERREALVENSVAWMLRQQIKEIYPMGIDNLLHLVYLAIKLETYTGEELTTLGLIDILRLEFQVIESFDLLMQVLRSVLDYAPLKQSSLDFVEACLVHTRDNTLAFLNTLLSAAVEIAYSQKQPAIAARLCELCLRLDAKNSEILLHLAGFYQNAGEYDKGIETAKLCYSLLQELPDLVFANRQILRGLMSAGGHWKEAYEVAEQQELLVVSLIKEQPRQLEQIQVLRLFNSNFFTPYFEDKPRKNRQIQNELIQVCHVNSRIYAKTQVERYCQGHIEKKHLIVSPKVLRIGYLSYCLKSHSVGWLARWVFQHYDREKFQVNAYFVNTKPSFDPLHEWYAGQVFKAYRSSNVFDIAEQIYQDEIDILIDLDSITLDISCEVMSLRPAPIQVSWLGWDASGIPTVDYFIADPYVLPELAQEYYTEKIWRLPQTYIAVDGFEVGVPTLRRSQLDIPSNAIVYLCAQRGFKRHPETTRLQMRIVKEVPNSYFLIKGMADEESNKSFLTQLAEEEGVDYNRLRFLPEVSSEATHRANLSIADVVLDTYPYNGATTTMETLWMCIPLVTRVGEQFAARNSYTMMKNAGVTEGIAWTDEEYVEWGVCLGKDETLRQKITWKLKASRQTSPLWNAKQFTHELEKAYEQMWNRYVKG